MNGWIRLGNRYRIIPFYKTAYAFFASFENEEVFYSVVILSVILGLLITVIKAVMG